MGQAMEAMMPESLEDRYYLQKVNLGKGSFGVVVRGVDRRTNEVVAIKQINKATMRKANLTTQDVEREVRIMQACSHPNILELFGSFDDEKCISLALEYCDGGDFGDKVNEKASSLQEHEAAEWMRQICGAIQALHLKNIVHRDVKPDNFMVSGSHPGLLKLADFGLSTFLEGGQPLTSKCGTPAFMAPEIHRLPCREGYRFEVDMWAAGVLMFCLLYRGQHPFIDSRGNMDMKSLVDGNLKFPAHNPMADLLPWQVQSDRSGAAEALCKRMVDPKPFTRITAQEALQNAWMKQSRQASPQPTPRCQPVLERKNSPSQHVPDELDLVRVNSNMKAKLEDNEARLEVSRQRERALMEMVGEKSGKNEAPRTLCAPSAAAQGSLPVGTKCRYFSATHKTWTAARVTSFNQSSGTYNLDVKAQASVANIAPKSDVKTEEAWPRGTFVTYCSASAGKDVPAVVFSFKVSAVGPSTYVLDVKDGAEVDRIRPRQL